jgi:hypothetical protein
MTSTTRRHWLNEPRDSTDDHVIRQPRRVSDSAAANAWATIGKGSLAFSREADRIEKAARESEHSLIGNGLGHPRHEPVMINSIEKFLQIEIDDPAATARNQALRPGYRLIRRASGPKLKTVLGEVRFEMRLQHLEQSLVHQSIGRGGDA